MADISAWSPIDESNTTAPPNGWPEFMMPAMVNNSARAMMGAVRRWYDQVLDGSLVLPYVALTGSTMTGQLRVDSAAGIVVTSGGTVSAAGIYSTGNVSATANGLFSGNLNVGLDATVGGALYLTGAANVGTLNCTGGATLGGTTTVGGLICTGNAGVSGTLNVGNIQCTNGINAGYYDCDGNRVIDTGGGATVLYKGGGVAGITLQNTATFYDNNDHVFRNYGTSNTFTIDTSGNVNATGSISAGGNVVTGGVFSGAKLQGGPSGAGNLQTWATGHAINFRYDTASTGQVAYRIDETLEKYIGTTTNVWDTQYYYPGGGPTGGVFSGHDSPGTWYYCYIDFTSDERIKNNIVPSEIDALGILKQVPVDQYDIKPEVAGSFRALGGIHGREVPASSGHVAIGLVAQKLQALIPEAVYVGPQPGDNALPEDCHNITLPAITPYLIRAVQQLATRLEALEGK